MNLFTKFLIITIFSISQISFAIQAPRNFQEAKKIARIIFSENPVTLYCQCRYDASFKVDLASCGMESGVIVKFGVCPLGGHSV
jgi:deoxyribonuclease-1